MSLRGRFYPELEGLRGVAILGVLFFHCFLVLRLQTPWAAALAALPLTGWLGVDVFFVISGFLITGILLDTRDAPARFRNFYARRVLRIVPVYYLLLAIVFFILPLFVSFDSPGLATIRHRQAWLWVHLTNLSYVFYNKVWTNAGWLDLDHLWSLAVEEQFYLIWPFLVWSLRPGPMRKVCVGCIAFSILLRIVLWRMGQRNGALYFPTPCRLDGLAMGALVAFSARGEAGLARLVRPARLTAALCAAGLCGLAMFRGGLIYTDKPTVVLGVVLVSLLTACVIVLVTAPGSGGFPARVLRSPALRFTGRYSYGLYLFHGVILTPLALLLPPGEIGNLLFVAVFLAIVFAAAILSWHAWERPWLRLKSRF